MAKVWTYRSVTSYQGMPNSLPPVLATYGEPDLLELLEVAIPGLGHRAAQTTDQVDRPEGVIGRAVEHVVERRTLAQRDLQQGAARKRRMRGGSRPEPAVTRRFGGGRQRGAQQDGVGAARDGLGQVARGV